MMVLSTDNVIEQIAKERNTSYSSIFKEVYGQANTVMYDNLRYCIENQLPFVWDQTNLTPKSRKSKLDKIPSDYKKIAICFEIDEEEFIKRNTIRAATGKNISLSIYQSMMSTYVRPSSSEGFSDVIIAT
jgi:predicted kinase